MEVIDLTLDDAPVPSTAMPVPSAAFDKRQEGGPVLRDMDMNGRSVQDQEKQSSVNLAQRHPRKITGHIDLTSDDDEIVILTGPCLSPRKKPHSTFLVRENAVASGSTSTTTESSRIKDKGTYAKRLCAEEDASFIEIYDTSDGEDAALAKRLAKEEGTMLAARPKINAKDALLAKRLAEEEEKALSSFTKLSQDDMVLAQRLEKEEKAQYEILLNRVSNQKEGIIFRQAINADGTLEDGTQAHPDDMDRFAPWREMFERSGYKVSKFHWIVNHELEKEFQLAAATLEAKHGAPPEELSLFHGTSAENVELILNGGFKIGGQSGLAIRNGAAYGYGIYLAVDATLSMTYACGSNKIFACRVLPGRVTTDRAFSNTMPVGAVGDAAYESYNNGVGNNPGGIYVVRYTSLVLPCYMIEFAQPFYGGYRNVGMIPAPAPKAPARARQARVLKAKVTKRLKAPPKRRAKGRARADA